MLWEARRAAELASATRAVATSQCILNAKNARNFRHARDTVIKDHQRRILKVGLKRASYPSRRALHNTNSSLFWNRHFRRFSPRRRRLLEWAHAFNALIILWKIYVSMFYESRRYDRTMSLSTCFEPEERKYPCHRRGHRTGMCQEKNGFKFEAVSIGLEKESGRSVRGRKVTETSYVHSAKNGRGEAYLE